MLAGAGRPVPELCCWGLLPFPLPPDIPHGSWPFTFSFLPLLPHPPPHVYLSWKNDPLIAFALVLSFPSVSTHLIAHL